MSSETSNDPVPLRAGEHYPLSATPVLRPKFYGVPLAKCENLKAQLTQASAVMPAEGENVELVRKWKGACGHNYRRLSAALEERRKEEQKIFGKADPELNDYQTERAAITEQFADPKQVRKKPEELQPGEDETIRIDPLKVREYNEAIKALDARFDELLKRMAVQAEELIKFYAEPVMFEVYYFLYGTENAPLEANGVHIVALDWMILEQGQEIAT